MLSAISQVTYFLNRRFKGVSLNYLKTIYINKDLFTEYTFPTIVSEVIVLTAIKYQLRYDLKGKIKDEPLRNQKRLLRHSI